jgi:hypothetical protein
MSARESTEAALARWDQLHLLQAHYSDFVTFLKDGMLHLGFSTSDIQEDIATYMEHGPASLMVQAQRGQAKTTIAALFSVYSLIHRPKTRVLVISAGGTQANEISTLIVRIIETMDVLECLRPDNTAGDRTSVEAYDVHHSLKGVDKSPSVACVGITANLQGKRADLLIPDDVESTKNGLTAIQRAQLHHLTLDFTSICVGRPELGMEPRILWLGTPQTTDSIYNSLPGRGVAVRIWPGRYPTAEQREHYGEFLAPLLVARMLANPSLCTGGGVMRDQGQPTDSLLAPESKLQSKEIDQGTPYFQLQHMLNTQLTDALRYPLKVDKLIVLRITERLDVPITVSPPSHIGQMRQLSFGQWPFRIGNPGAVASMYAKLPAVHMYIDPAGGGANGDETGYAVSALMNGNIYLLDVGGLKGGYDPEQMRALKLIAIKWGVHKLSIEKNMGYGAFREVFLPVLRAPEPDKPQGHACEVIDDYVTGQKETRIAATLEPIIGRGSLIVNEEILVSDWATAQKYGATRALQYSFFYQMAKLTKERGALVHDDRLDAVEGTCRFWQPLLAQDQEKALKAAQEAAFKQMTKDPLGHNRYKQPPKRGSILSRRLR